MLSDLEELALADPCAAGSSRCATASLRAYDASSIALAEALDCPLLTRDGRLARAGGHAARVEVR